MINAAQRNKIKCVKLWPRSTTVYDCVPVDVLFLNCLKKRSLAHRRLLTCKWRGIYVVAWHSIRFKSMWSTYALLSRPLLLRHTFTKPSHGWNTQMPLHKNRDHTACWKRRSIRYVDLRMSNDNSTYTFDCDSGDPNMNGWQQCDAGMYMLTVAHVLYCYNSLVLFSPRSRQYFRTT